MRLAREGASWSGSERNNGLIHTGRDSFADISSQTGFDYPDDGRALAVTDWDHDGDLDLWWRNRTAPRLRFTLNQQEPNDDAVSIRLIGKQANADAIGARVELKTDPSGPSLVRSVQAGGYFLSQSTKWLHFGLGHGASAMEAVVSWPGAGTETFPLSGRSGHFILRQGEGKSEPWSRPGETVALRLAAETPVPAPVGTAQIVLPARVPLPPLPELAKFPQGKGPRVLMIWASWCPNCQRELTGMVAGAEQLTRAGVDVLALSIEKAMPDAGGSAEEAAALMQRLGISSKWGFLEERSLELLHHWFAGLFDKTPQVSVPLAVLLGADGNAVAIYRGSMPVEAIVHDARTLGTASDAELRDLAPPVAGTWVTKPAVASFAPLMLARRFQADYPKESLAFFAEAERRAIGDEKNDLRAELKRKHYALARKSVQKQDAQGGESHFVTALEYGPKDATIHNDFGTMLAQLGRLQEAEAHFRMALELDSDYDLARRNLEKARQLLQR